MSVRLRLLNAACRLAGKPRLHRATRPEPLRTHFNRVAWLLGGSLRGVIETAQETPFAARIVAPASHREGGVVLYFHGGGYVAGSPWTHRGLARSLVRASGVPVMLPVYGLGPEAPFPAAQVDARRAWDGLVAGGLDPQRIVIGGDSAGGGLALSLLADLLAEDRRPAGVFLFSPWTDLSGSGASHVANAGADPLFPPERLADLVGFVAPGTDPTDPRLSPLFARFDRPPPVFITCSETELLLDDARGMADVLRRSGGEVTLRSWPDAVHAWPVFHDLIPEGRAAIAEAAAFIRARLSLP